MINENEIIKDPLDDAAGPMLAALKKEKTWTKSRRAIRDNLVRILKKHKYMEFDANKKGFCLSGIGDSMLYQVPVKKTGHLLPFRGKLVRIVCTGYVGDFTYTLMVGKYKKKNAKIAA